jgi:inner membrane protein involved in colicin E2 resistance
LSRRLFLKYVALFVAEDFLLCIPMLLLRNIIAMRNKDLRDHGFELIEEEASTTQLVDK